MEKYNQLLPNATERFLTLAEKQSHHRQELEKIEVLGQNKRAKWGLIAGWSLSIFLCGIGAFLLYNNKDIGVYVALVFGTLPRIISFIYSKYDRERQIKRNKDN